MRAPAAGGGGRHLGDPRGHFGAGAAPLGDLLLSGGTQLVPLFMSSYRRQMLNLILCTLALT